MLTRLQVTHLRNITAADLHLGSCNVFIGDNGSGKTSLLEAVFLLSRGKSFRHHQPKRYIQHHQSAVTVHAKLAGESAGATLAIQKQLDATTILRLNQSTVYTQSALTQQLPTLLIDPSSMDMLEQGSANRRQLLDWLAFHMKPGFHPQWLAYQRLLKQRNRLLKQTQHLTLQQRQELASWDKGLSNHAALIHHYRQQVFAAWQPYFQQCVQALLPRYAGKISLSYSAGYDADNPLDEQLQARIAQDLQQGFTRIGSHRADVQVYWRSENQFSTDLKMQGIEEEVEDADPLSTIAEAAIEYDAIATEGEDEEDELLPIQPRLKEQAANVLSRGEKKLLITALKLSQLPLLLADNSNTNITTNSSQSVPYLETMQQSNFEGPLAVTPVVLLDDITAELDTSAVQILLTTLASLPCQVFITSLSEEVLPMVDKYWTDYKLFHVKQGKLQLVSH